MKKKTFICLLIFVLTMAIGTGTLAYADSLSEINEQKDEVKNDMQALTESIEEQQAEVDKIQASIDEKQAEIDASEAKISEAEAEIEQTKKDMEKRQEGLNGRLRTMYKNGSVGYLDVLLGSNSLSEFLSNIEMVQRIYKNDQDTMKELKRQHEELEVMRAELEKQKESLEAERAELDEERAGAQAKQDELQGDKEALQAKLDELNAEADRISSEIAGMQNPEIEYEGGTFMWPTNTRLITSYFGYRIHPVTGIYTGHTGVDIGCSYGSPVYAAADGTVIVASYGYGGYGVAVVIDHGSGISTLYGHNDSLHVSAGQKVSRGQVIATSGNSGISTGPHLHFEVREGGAYVDPLSYF